MTQEQIAAKIKEQKILPLFYHDDPKICLSVTRAIYEGGMRCLEFTNRGFNALDNFRRLHQWRNESMKDMLLAVGTVKTADDATRFLEAGADLLISPVFDAGVCTVTKAYNKLWIPGCMTPTEIHVASAAGCALIKLFPGNVLGPGFVEAIRPLFKGIDFIITGGVEATRDNMALWFGAGAAGVGMGTKLITKQIVEQGGFDQLKAKTEELRSIVAAL